MRRSMGSDGARRRATLAHVAERAGVSLTTASFVLSGRTDMRIATTTADRVQEAARVLDYAPRVNHGLTRGMQHETIGFISDTVASEPYGGDMIRGAITAAAAHSHSLVIAEHEREGIVENESVRDLVKRGVTRFVYTAMYTRTVRVPEVLQEHRTVLLNCQIQGGGLPAIVPDERAAGAAAVRTLLEHGHRERIWLVGEVVSARHVGAWRLSGIKKVMSRHGVTLARHLSCRWWPPDAAQAMSTALRDRTIERPTAVIALNDRAAMGVYQAAADYGLTIPGDLSVISFDNSELAWWLKPGLTSLGIPYLEMGRHAITVLLSPPTRPQVERMPMPLHERDSVAAPAR